MDSVLVEVSTTRSTLNEMFYDIRRQGRSIGL